MTTESNDSSFYRPRVLVADDISFISNYLRNVLSQLACEVVETALDGQDAITKYLRTKPDLMFLDINMPVKNGLDVLVEILQADPKAYIVIISGDGTFQNVKLAIDRGAKGFIVKPFNVDKFKEAVSRFRSQRGGASPPGVSSVA